MGVAGGKLAKQRHGSSAVPRQGRAAQPARTERAQRPARPEPNATMTGATGDWRAAVRATVEGLHYDLVDLERGLRGLLRVTIDRRAAHTYASPGAAVTVDDCEAVTRQLQYALEVEGLEYARLEVSSPGLDRPLRSEADYERFSGHAVSVALKQPFQGRKVYQGVLARALGALAAGHAQASSPSPWQLTFKDGKAEQVLSFALDEVREARLVPVVNFKGLKSHSDPAAATKEAPAASEVDGGSA